VSWSLPTATATYTVAMAGEGAGPVLQDWSDQPVRAWQPTARQGFETDLDRLPSEFSALGGRHVRVAELVVDQ
jgi:hypothetical protein